MSMRQFADAYCDFYEAAALPVVIVVGLIALACFAWQGVQGLRGKD